MAAKISVQKVTTPRQMKTFIRFPWTSGIYRDDPAWVPPLIRDQKQLFDRKKSYFFEVGDGDFFLACRDGKPVGRITAHVNHLYEERYDNETGFFGFYESVNDPQVAEALFDTAAGWLRDRGKSRMQGPQSFSIYDSVGFEVLGEDIMPVVGIFHFAPYYKDLAVGYGFRKSIDWSCYLVRKIQDYEPYLKQVREEILGQQEVEYKTLVKKELPRRVDQMFKVFNRAWEGNWGHLPLTDKQRDTLVEELKIVVIPELCLFAEKDGEVVGFILSLPDMNPALRILNGHLYPWRLPRFFREIKRSRKLRTIIMGVLPEYRGKKIDDVFYLHTIEEGIKRGFTASDCSLIVETNQKMIGALKPLGAECYKTYRIYEKDIA